MVFESYEWPIIDAMMNWRVIVMDIYFRGPMKTWCRTKDSQERLLALATKTAAAHTEDNGGLTSPGHGSHCRVLHTATSRLLRRQSALADVSTSYMY